MRRETADAFWDAVEHALHYETPEWITEELTREVEERSQRLPPGA